MKKICKLTAMLLCLFLSVSAFSCADNDSVTEESENITETSENVTEAETEDETLKWKDIFMYSDDERLCFLTSSDAVDVIYYSGDDVIGYRQYIMCTNSNEADSYAEQVNEAGFGDDMQEVYSAGKLLVFIYSESGIEDTFGDKNISQVREMYSGYIEIVK